MCVGLTSKPARGSEWLCTSCSGSSSKLKRKSATPEVRSKRARSPDDGVEERSKRIHLRKDEAEQATPGKKGESFKKKGVTGSKSKMTPPILDYKTKPEFSDDDDDDDEEEDVDNIHDDLRYSDDSLQDKDFEPQESDYDEKEMRLSPGSRLNPSERDQRRKKRLSSEEDFDEMSRDDLRRLCQKEQINATGNRVELVSRLKRHYRKQEEKAKHKEEPKVKVKKFKLTEVTRGDGLCKICGLGWELPDDLELGPLYKYGACQACKL